MVVVLPADPGEMVRGGAVALHVFLPGAGEHLQGHRGATEGTHLGEHAEVLVQGSGQTPRVDGEAAGCHLFEADRQCAVQRAGADGLAGEVETRRPRRAGVVDVDHRYAGEPDLVEGALPGAGGGLDEAGERGLDVGVVEAGVLQRGRHRLGHHVGEVPPFPPARLLELRHAGSDDEHPSAHCHALLRVNVSTAFTLPSLVRLPTAGWRRAFGRCRRCAAPDPVWSSGARLPAGAASAPTPPWA